MTEGDVKGKCLTPEELKLQRRCGKQTQMEMEVYDAERVFLFEERRI